MRRQVVHWSLLFLILFLVSAHFGYNRFFNHAFGIRGLKENILSKINGVTYLMTRLILIFRLNIDPDLPVISKAGRYKEAERAYSKALELKPDYWIARNNLTKLLMDKKK